MGCGGHPKETDDTVKKLTLPTSRPFGSRLLPDPRNKLSPEVLEGFTKLIKSFYFYDTGVTAPKGPAKQPPLKPQLAISGDAKVSTGPELGPEKGKPGDGQGKETANANASAVNGGTASSQAEKLGLEAAKREAEYQAKNVTNPFQDLLSEEQNKTDHSDLLHRNEGLNGAGKEGTQGGIAGEMGKEGGGERGVVGAKRGEWVLGEGAEEHRFSPEPPRPEELSDDEDGRYEDPGIRAARLEKERIAKEEAERRAVEVRLEEERNAAQREGVMSNMQSEAENILSKYQ